MEEMATKFAYLRIPLEEIVSATNNFSDQNLIRRGRFGRAYRGKLLRSGEWIDIVARRLDIVARGFGKSLVEGYKEFWTEVSMLSTLKHDNLVSIIGYCDEKGVKIIINKHETLGSLDNYLEDQTLTWMQRLEICVGVARALSYIYFDKGRDFSVVHNNIKSSQILLEDNWKPKLSGFKFSVTTKTTQRHEVLFHRIGGIKGYIDPIYENGGGVTHKSDMYSFGVVLFEVLCGRRASIDDSCTKEQHRELNPHIPQDKFLAPLARFHYEKKNLGDMIDPDLWKQMNPQSFDLFSEIAYCCIKEQRSARPDIHQVLIRLEKALDIQRKYDETVHDETIRPKLFSVPLPLRNPLKWLQRNLKEHAEVEDTSTKHSKLKKFRHLEIPLGDIEKATKNFDKAYLIGSGTYGEVYKAELDHFDSKNFLSLEEKNKGKFSKKRSTVAIKRIIIREDKQGEEGFLAEIEMLASCKHPNIVSLLGFCDEGPRMIPVYEHASNGSLDDYMGSTPNLTYLSWVQRINICVDIARGLNYLHSNIEGDRRIIHRDIKSFNILLGENLEAKIADFGLSRFRPENQQSNMTLYTQTLAGTDLYLDPKIH